MTKVYGRSMVEIPRSEWPITGMFETEPLRVWRSADYLAVLYRQRANNMLRLTVNTTKRGRSKRPRQDTDWRDGITWDELQRIKNETLGEEVWCVEVYPAESAKVDVYNQRHLWPLEEAPVTRFPTKSVFTDNEIAQAAQLAMTLRKAMAI